jgi:uncharacterized linocin/CFP29 family protein
MNEVNWDQSIWQAINDAVKMEMGKVRISQRVFPTMMFDMNPTEVPNDVINFQDPDGLSIREGSTKPFVEIYQEFPLTNTQVSKEAQNKTCKTLARMAAKSLALAEDTIIFQGNTGSLPGNVKADQRDSTLAGLLGEADPKDANNDDDNKVTVSITIAKLKNSQTGAVFGENVFSAVADGIASLTRKAQAPNYALFLPTKVYADTFVPPSPASLVTTAERIKPLVEGGFYGTGTLPEDKGLLVALGGDPTSLYLGREATTEFLRKDGAKYFFRVVERIQFVARDPRAFVLLKFDSLHPPAKP